LRTTTELYDSAHTTTDVDIGVYFELIGFAGLVAPTEETLSALANARM
jgi:hypothetical protein